jgi:hypothetical protein
MYAAPGTSEPTEPRPFKPSHVGIAATEMAEQRTNMKRSCGAQCIGEAVIDLKSRRGHVMGLETLNIIGKASLWDCPSLTRNRSVCIGYPNGRR